MRRAHQNRSKTNDTIAMEKLKHKSQGQKLTREKNGLTVSEGNMNVVVFGPKMLKKNVRPYTITRWLLPSFPHLNDSKAYSRESMAKPKS